MKKNNNNQSILYGVIFILLIAIIYLGYEKFSNNQLSKAIKNVQCTAPSKICVLTTHKYTDKLEVQLEILPGKDYYKDDKLKSYEKYLSDWEKDKKNRDMFDSSLVIKNFVESLNAASGNIFIHFEDSDGFQIDELMVDLDNKSKDSSRGIISRSRSVTVTGEKYGIAISFKKNIELDNFKRISETDLLWHGKILNSLPETN